MEYYNETIAPAKNIEVIHVNFDRSEKDMASFMEAFKMPWPAIDFDKIEKVETVAKFDSNAVPNYVLVSAQGELVAKGMGAAKAKIAELLASSSGS